MPMTSMIPAFSIEMGVLFFILFVMQKELGILNTYVLFPSFFLYLFSLFFFAKNEERNITTIIRHQKINWIKSRKEKPHENNSFIPKKKKNQNYCLIRSEAFSLLIREVLIQRKDTQDKWHNPIASIKTAW